MPKDLNAGAAPRSGGRHFEESREAMHRSVVAEQIAVARVERSESAVEQSRSLIERIWATQKGIAGTE